MPRIIQPEPPKPVPPVPADWEADVLSVVGAGIWMICALGLVLAFLRIVWWGFTGG
jgi:hypothetical protein